MKLINFKKKKMNLLTKEEQEAYVKHEKHRKVRDHCHYTVEYRSAAHMYFKI